MNSIEQRALETVQDFKKGKADLSYMYSIVNDRIDGEVKSIAYVLIAGLEEADVKYWLAFEGSDRMNEATRKMVEGETDFMTHLNWIEEEGNGGELERLYKLDEPIGYSVDVKGVEIFSELF